MKNKKKILIASNSLWNLYNYRLNLIKKLSKKFQVTIISPNDFDIDKFELRNLNFVNLSIDSKGLNPLNDIRYFYKVQRCIKEINPDLIVTFTIKPNIYVAFVALCLNIKYVVNITGLGSATELPFFIRSLILLLYKISFKNVSHIFFQNNSDRSFFEKHSITVRSNSTVLPGSGVDLKKFSKKRTIKTNDKTNFILVSRLIRNKGIEEFMSAALSLSESGFSGMNFYLLGKAYPKDRNSISLSELDRFAEAGVIKYIGFSENVSDILEKMDCIVLPTTYSEGSPRSLIEGLAKGLPVITTQVAGCKNIVDNNINGYFCRSKSVQDLAKKMLAIHRLSNSQKWEMGIKSREKAENVYDEKIVINKVISVIERFV